MEIKLNNVSKTIKSSTVIDSISISFTSGRIYGLCGYNGCGKTMLMRLITGLIRPTAGEIYIDGKMLGRDIDFPESVGLLLENPSFLDRYTGLENLRLIASLKGKTDMDALKLAMRRVNLLPDDKRKYRKYSLGMKQKLGIAAAIMELPDLIILDEPTNALDAQSLEMLKKIIIEEKQRGALLIIASHESNFIGEVADEMIELENGHIKQKEDGQ